MQHKSVLVTGAAQGIGRRLVEALAANGARVSVTGRDLVKAQDLADGLSQKGYTVLASPLDVTDRESVVSAVARSVEAFGSLDILVNNAGISITKPSVELDEREWDEVLDTNLKGVFLCCQAAGIQMIKQRSGVIVTVASVLGIVGVANACAYAASKGGVIQLTRSLALEWAPHGIRVNAVAPTTVETELTRRRLADRQTRIDILRKIPLGRVAQREDVVSAILFLVSNASQFITGEVLAVDGGYLSQ